MSNSVAPLTSSDFSAPGYEALLLQHLGAPCRHRHGVLSKAAESAWWVILQLVLEARARQNKS
jgi:hypothetical protein